MIKSLLLDLDDTLLGNSVQNFMNGYFSLLSDYARPHFDEATFLPSLIQATQVMVHNTDPALTNDQVFWRAFEGMTGGKRDELEPFFTHFYEDDFLRLQAQTEMRPAAAQLVNMAMERGLSVVVATNPLFPQRAIEHRLEWAGLPVSQYDFALVTTYENMHAAKPQPAYYREILATVGVRPEQALMVGDDWKNDIAPAATAGLYTYWIAAEDAAPPDPSILHGQGTLDALAERVANGWLEQLGTSTTL